MWFTNAMDQHDDVIKWKHFPRYWPFVLGIHRSPVNSPHKGQWGWALIFSLICVWINGWVNNREAGDLIRYRAHYDVTVMVSIIVQFVWPLLLHFYVANSTHYSVNTVKISVMGSQITSLTIVYSTVYSGTNQRKHQSSASLAFVRGIHRWPVNSTLNWPVTRINISIWWRHHDLFWSFRIPFANKWSLIPAWISNHIYYYDEMLDTAYHIHHNMWDEITYPFPNFNGYAVEVWEWIGNFTQHFIMDVIIHAGIEANPSQQKGPEDAIQNSYSGFIAGRRGIS